MVAFVVGTSTTRNMIATPVQERMVSFLVRTSPTIYWPRVCVPCGNQVKFVMLFVGIMVLFEALPAH